MSQSFPDKAPLDGIILDGQLSSTESLWSKDRKTVYTINWFKPHRIYSGDASPTDSIPVLTLGGATDEGLMVVTHSLNFHYGYNYMLSLKSCLDCLDDMPAYLTTRVAADFNRKHYLAAKKIWETKPNLSKKEKDCDPTDGYLRMKFGNVYLNPGPEFITGHLDLKLRTENSYNDLYSLISEIKYDTNVFGDYAVGSESLQVNPTDSVVLSDYALLSQDLQANKADFSFQRNQQAAQSIVISPDYQSVLRLSFTIPASSLDNLPEKLKDLFELRDLSGEFMCDGRIYSFDRIEIEDSTIGVQIEGMTSSISYSIVGMEYDDSNPTDLTYTFTVMASSTNLTHLKEASLRFSHNTTAFVANHINNGLLTIIDAPGTIYTEFIDDFAVSASQLDANSFRILIFDDNPNTPIGELPLLDETPVPLIRLRMRVNDCEENPEFAFLESEMQEESFFYDPINDFALFSYVDVMTSEPLIVPLCGCDDQPDIDTYTEDELVAGDGQVLTITGSNFGVFNRGMPGEGGTGSSVLFTNADYQGTGDVTHPEFIAAGLRDFIIDDVLSWTDEEIQVKVPSTDWQTGIPGKAGSGRFIIRNGCNIEKQSGILQKLKIPYSLQNYRESNEGRALKLGLRQNNEGVNGDENGYHFKLTQELEDEAVLDIRQEFTNALSDWCNETSINFKLKEGVDAVNTYDNDDNRNSVTYFDSDTGGGAMITGILYYKITCGNPGEENDAGYIMTDIDFRINKASIDADADESLLRKILRHELGHAHQLGHALDKAGTPKPLMEPTINSNSSGTIQDDDSAGGNRVFATSAAIVEKGCYIGIPSNGVPVIPMSTGGCGETVEVKEVFSSGEIEVFPNPTQDEIIISAHSGLSSFEYEIYSIAGHRLLTGSCDNSNCLINIHELPKGTHTITITAENFLTTAKIVKL